MTFERIVTKDELLDAVLPLSCFDCGYEPAGSDPCIEKEGDTFSFVCPRCGSVTSWRPEPIQ